MKLTFNFESPLERDDALKELASAMEKMAYIYRSMATMGKFGPMLQVGAGHSNADGSKFILAEIEP